MELLKLTGGQIFQFQSAETGKRVALSDFAVEIPSIQSSA